MLRAECPGDLQPQIFDQGRALTPWLRIEDFQIVSLQIIAEAAPPSLFHSRRADVALRIPRLLLTGAAGSYALIPGEEP